MIFSFGLERLLVVCHLLPSMAFGCNSALDLERKIELISVESSDFRRQISPVKYRYFLNLALTIASRCVFDRAP